MLRCYIKKRGCGSSVVGNERVRVYLSSHLQSIFNWLLLFPSQFAVGVDCWASVFLLLRVLIHCFEIHCNKCILFKEKKYIYLWRIIVILLYFFASSRLSMVVLVHLSYNWYSTWYMNAKHRFSSAAQDIHFSFIFLIWSFSLYLSSISLKR
jgi:hypothetical protein